MGSDRAGRYANGAARPKDARTPPVGGKAIPQLAVMPHELLAAIEQHLASPATALDNGDEWGLVQRWLTVAAQREDGGGDPTKRQAHIAFATGS